MHIDIIDEVEFSHNPYFNRWFSAIGVKMNIWKGKKYVTILILIDGFLQYCNLGVHNMYTKVTILILIDGFLQYKLVQNM